MAAVRRVGLFCFLGLKNKNEVKTVVITIIPYWIIIESFWPWGRFLKVEV